MTAAGRLLSQVATLGPVGFFPKAPGTLASLLGIGFLWALKPGPWVLAAMTLLCGALGVVSSSEAEKVLGKKDPPEVVVDEFFGVLIAMAALPYTAGYFIFAFILFRFFDILKPPPIGGLQRLRGGWGIMADDLAAGVCANLVLQAWRTIL